MKKQVNKPQGFAERLQAGLDLSFKRLVKSKQQSNGIFIFSKNGKIVKVKAKDIKL